MAATGLDIPAIARAVRQAASGTRVTRAYLFGSRARGDSHEGSDIDLCVEAERGFTLLDAGRLADTVSTLCACEVDVVSDRFLTPSARERIMRDRVLLYENHRRDGP